MLSLLQVVDQLPAAVVVTNLGDDVVAASPAARAMLELKLGKLGNVKLEARLAALNLPAAPARAPMDSEGVAYLVVGLDEAAAVASPADVSTLAHAVAHDFNNLLGVIINFTSMAAADLPTTSNAHRDLGEVLNAANRAATLTQRLQLLGHAQADGQTGDS